MKNKIDIQKNKIIIDFKYASYKWFYQRIWLIKIISQKKKIIIKNCKDSDINEIAKILNIKSKKDRLIYIYDYVCDYIDQKYVNVNFCGFKNNRCSCQNKGINGCCNNCQYLYDKVCSIKAISCKMFFCPFIRQKKRAFKIKDIVLLKYFLSWPQKIMIKYNFYCDKEEVINCMLKPNLIKWCLKPIKKVQK